MLQVYFSLLNSAVYKVEFVHDGVCRRNQPQKGYSEAVEHYYGAIGAMTTIFFIAFLNFGTSIAYLDVIGDIIVVGLVQTPKLQPFWRF